MNTPYIYESDKNDQYKSSEKAILVLPDIYGQTDYAKNTVNELAQTFALPVYLLDYFYELTGQANNINADHAEVAHDLMQKMTGNDFLAFFDKATTKIDTDYQSYNSFIVIGFCFAGRLSYLTSTNSLVTKIVSFYGGGANLPNFVHDKSAIEYLIRVNRKNVSILSFYGIQDESIPQSDREQTYKLLTGAGVNYDFKEYDAGHAYFQPGRPNYNQVAAEASWQDLKQFLA